ncbi:MAG: hypothetical protein EZS28_027428 [Streblomastix strix]|uniref:Uncharacterized protein n=1 Tax=Streblomastix strix TaxID=222440 RepID=A0A5J4V344_9EUKA|nr:MAG: hypothetical protein EZS28_027428 [Streblomastix strix]
MFQTVGYFALLGLSRFSLLTIACTIGDYATSLMSENILKTTPKWVFNFRISSSAPFPHLFSLHVRALLNITSGLTLNTSSNSIFFSSIYLMSTCNPVLLYLPVSMLELTITLSTASQSNITLQNNPLNNSSPALCLSILQLSSILVGLIDSGEEITINTTINQGKKSRIRKIILRTRFGPCYPVRAMMEWLQVEECKQRVEEKIWWDYNKIKELGSIGCS